MQHLRSRAALFAAATSLGAVALPAAAHATVTPVGDDAANTLKITSDQASDAITVTAGAGANYVVNGVDTGLPAAADIAIAVDAGAGNDTLDASALAANQYASLTADGGDGDDLLTGGVDGDHLIGGAGNDRVVGFRGGDDLDGGAGNDTLVWNNGDGTDTDDGEGGIDELEVNGAATAGDVFAVSPGAVAGRTQFNRTNLVAFGIDASAEKLTVNGLGGDDAVTGAPGLAASLSGGMALNGGIGNDTITGGDTADLITGGDGDDTLRGAGGADRVVGDRGTDALEGGDGDDTLVWNNGDGSDVDTGGTGLDRTEVNGAGAGDAFTVAPSGARARFERTNLVPFALDVDTEALDVRGLGGDDTLGAVAGLGGRVAITVDGGAGNDVLTGGEEVDTFFGGLGDDTLGGGGAADVLDGQDGNDALRARDGVGDLVRGGAGFDNAQVDPAGVDAVDGVEALDAAPGAPPAPVKPSGGAADVRAFAAKVTTTKARLTRSGGRLVARMKVTCPAAEAGGCRATVSLATAKAITIGGVKVVAVLGAKRVTLKAGQTKAITIKLAGGAGRLARNGKLATRATVVTKDAAGNVATSSRAVALTLPGRS